MSQSTYRFKFNRELLGNIREFSKLHSNDSCDEFMSEFNLWIRSNQSLIDSEKARIENLGFKGDIEKKIYKSARYYFKHKANKAKENAFPISSKSTNYISRSPYFSKTVESYILNNPIKASVLFQQFINETDESIQISIRNEKNRLANYQLNDEMVLKKIRKSFDNAYYKIKKQLKRQEKQQ